MPAAARTRARIACLPLPACRSSRVRLPTLPQPPFSLDIDFALQRSIYQLTRYGIRLYLIPLLYFWDPVCPYCALLVVCCYHILRSHYLVLTALLRALRFTVIPRTPTLFPCLHTPCRYVIFRTFTFFGYIVDSAVRTFTTTILPLPRTTTMTPLWFFAFLLRI